MALGDLWHKFLAIIGLVEEDDEGDPRDWPEDEDGNYEEYEEQSHMTGTGPVSTGGNTRRKSAGSRPGANEEGSRKQGHSNVTPLRAAESASNPHNAVLVYVRRKEDGQVIIGHVLEGSSVFMNCEEIDDAQCQRVLDMLSGAAFALNGRIKRVSYRSYLFAPSTVTIVGDSVPAPRREREDA